MTAPLAVLAQRQGIGAIVWETAGARLRIRFDEAAVDPDSLRTWLQEAGYTVTVTTLLAPDTMIVPPPATLAPTSEAPSLAWIEMIPDA